MHLASASLRWRRRLHGCSTENDKFPARQRACAGADIGSSRPGTPSNWPFCARSAPRGANGHHPGHAGAREARGSVRPPPGACPSAVSPSPATAGPRPFGASGARGGPQTYPTRRGMRWHRSPRVPARRCRRGGVLLLPQRQRRAGLRRQGWSASAPNPPAWSRQATSSSSPRANRLTARAAYSDLEQLFNDPLALVQRRAALAPTNLPPLAFPGAPELGDDHRLVQLSHRAQDLADEGRGRRIVHEHAGAVGSDDLDTAVLEYPVPRRSSRSGTGGLLA